MWKKTKKNKNQTSRTNLEATFLKSLSDRYMCAGDLNDLMTNVEFFLWNWLGGNWATLKTGEVPALLGSRTCVVVFCVVVLHLMQSHLRTQNALMKFNLSQNHQFYMLLLLNNLFFSENPCPSGMKKSATVPFFWNSSRPHQSTLNTP